MAYEILYYFLLTLINRRKIGIALLLYDLENVLYIMYHLKRSLKWDNFCA